MSEYLDKLRAAAEAEHAAIKAGLQPTTEVQPDDESQDGVPDDNEPQTPPAPVAPVVEVPPAPVADPEEEKPAPGKRVVYKKTIDLGDGTPPQVFKASTKDELIDKILTAQTNASKRIKELKEQNRKLQQEVQPDPQQEVRQYKPRSLSTDEEIELINDLQSKPTEAVAKAIEAILGGSIDDIRADIAYGRQAKQKAEYIAVGHEFMTKHPEYPTTPQNEKLMAEYIRTNKLGWTIKNLELAFADLQEAGLVRVGSAPVNNDDDEIEVEEVPAAPVQQAPAPVTPAPAPTTSVEVPRRRRAVVGISSKQSAAAAEPEAPREASVDDFLKLPFSERRRIVQAQLGKQG